MSSASCFASADLLSLDFLSLLLLFTDAFARFFFIGTKSSRPDFHRVGVPAHRRTPLRGDWERLYTPIVQHLHLQIRYNTRLNAIELKVRAAAATVRAPLRRASSANRKFFAILRGARLAALTQASFVVAVVVVLHADV